MSTLAEIVKQEIKWYAAGGFDSDAFVLTNDDQQIYAVNSVVETPEVEYPTDVIMMARVVGDYVVILDDRTDKPFEKRLMAAGIPREKIILAYAGEKLPDSHQN